MDINRLLLKSHYEKLQEEFRKLERDIQHHPSAEMQPLAAYVQRKIHQLELTQDAIFAPASAQTLAPENFQGAFRRLKLELRFAQRKWIRVSANQIRFQKFTERPLHVSPFAA